MNKNDEWNRIVTFSVDLGMKQRGRVYVCDLAGTEPAGDIVYALYEKKTFPDGMMGPTAFLLIYIF